MIQHVALFSFNKNATPDIKRKLLKTLRQLPAYIPEIKSYKLGKDFSKRQTCFEYGLVSEFDTKMNFYTYMAHPVHQELLQRAMPYLEKFAEVDFEIE